MKETVKKVLSFALAFLMTFGACDTAVAYAAEEVVKAVNPTSGILLNVPEKYKNAGDLFFIEKADWALYEKSGEPVYIPIQRTGDLNKDAEITLKVIDLTAKHDVNYTAEIYKDKTDPTISYADVSVKELTLSDSAEIKEVETTDENGMAKAIYEAGGADITDASGTVIGSVKALPLDENGNLIETGEKTGEEQPAAETTAPAAETAAPTA
ncbi:MAG: hypothetical protein IJS65_05705, partial [Clostridia bacterium]|nr:hypothetical protein [Clostridia bacterium]